MGRFPPCHAPLSVREGWGTISAQCPFCSMCDACNQSVHYVTRGSRAKSMHASKRLAWGKHGTREARASHHVRPAGGRAAPRLGHVLRALCASPRSCQPGAPSAYDSRARRSTTRLMSMLCPLCRMSSITRRTWAEGRGGEAAGWRQRRQSNSCARPIHTSLGSEPMHRWCRRRTCTERDTSQQQQIRAGRPSTAVPASSRRCGRSP